MCIIKTLCVTVIDRGTKFMELVRCALILKKSLILRGVREKEKKKKNFAEEIRPDFSKGRLVKRWRKEEVRYQEEVSAEL